VKDRSRRRQASEREIVSHINPQSPGDGLSSGQHWHRRIIAVQPLGRQYVRGDQRHQRRQGTRAGANPIGERRDTENDALKGETFALPVQRLMLAEFGEHDRRQQVRTGASARDGMERCRRLGDRLAGAARELLTHCLDHLVAARDALQRLGDGLAEFGELAAAAGATRRRWQHDPLARQMRWQRAAYRFRPCKGPHGRLIRRRVGGNFILGRGGLEFLELHLQLIEQFATALGRSAETVALHFGDQQFQVRDHRLGAGGTSFRFATCLLFGGEGRAKCFGIGGNRFVHGNDSTTIASRWVQEIRLIHDEFSQPLPAAMCEVDFSNLSPPACSRVERR